MEDRLVRDDLTDDEWERLAPLLPSHARQGNRWADHRMIINGVFFRSRADCPWRKLPEVYGKWKTVYNRHRRWCLDGTWEMILKALAAGLDGTPCQVARTIPGDIRPGMLFEVEKW